MTTRTAGAVAVEPVAPVHEHLFNSLSRLHGEERAAEEPGFPEGNRLPEPLLQ